MGKGACKSRVCISAKRPKPTRSQRRNCLFYGEGQTEYSFLCYLHTLYPPAAHRVSRKGGQGGGQIELIASALTYKSGLEDFDDIYILLDSDNYKGAPYDSMIAEAKRKLRPRQHSSRRALNPKLYFSTPHCLEGFFLSILGVTVPCNSEKCKRLFHATYLSADEKMNPSQFSRIFPKEFLERRRAEVRLLDEIIFVFEGCS